MAAALLALPATGAGASVQTWYLHDVTFPDGASLTGQFTYNTTTDTLVSWDIWFLNEPTPGYSPYFFSNSIFPDVYSQGPQDFKVGNLVGAYFILDLASPLTSAGGDISVSSSEFVCPGCGGLTFSGESGFVATPEPAAWALMLAGFASLGAALRARRRLAPA